MTDIDVELTPGRTVNLGVTTPSVSLGVDTPSVTLGVDTPSITLDVHVVATSGGGGGGASALDDLTDVTITTPATDQVLKYNGSGWVNGTGGGGVADHGALTGLADDDHPAYQRNTTTVVNATSFTLTAADQFGIVVNAGETITLPDAATNEGRTVWALGLADFYVATAGTDTFDGANTSVSFEANTIAEFVAVDGSALGAGWLWLPVNRNSDHPYTPTTAGDWAGTAPDRVGDALDRLAAAFTANALTLP